MSGPRAGDVVGGDYRVEKRLAGGGMGAVYVAQQLSTKKRRALKVMLPELASDPRSRQRFIEEAQVGARIASSHVVEVIAAGFDEALGSPWLAMELLEGEDLEQVMQREGPLATPRVAELFSQLAHGLGRAHAQGIIHRDLKPENLFLARDQRVSGAGDMLKVLDFGIAALVATGKSAATVTTAIGSPFWVAPEQMQPGEKLRPSTDVWAMGLIAFYLLTGKRYWLAASAEEFSIHALLLEAMTMPLVPASERAKEIGAVGLPAGFDAWFARCVVRDPAERFANADEAASAFPSEGEADTARLLSPTAPLPTPAPTRPLQYAADAPRPRRSNGTIAALVLLALVTIGGLGAYALWPSHTSEPLAMHTLPPAGPEPAERIVERPRDPPPPPARVTEPPRAMSPTPIVHAPEQPHPASATGERCAQLEGVYRLTPRSSGPVQITQHGAEIHASANGWTGNGRIGTRTGSYRWRSTAADRRSGITDIEVANDGTLRLHVVGDDHREQRFVARRQQGAVEVGPCE